MKDMRHHGFHSTTVHHHKDGSHTVHHHHMEPEKDMEHAVADHDGMMDSMHQNLAPEMGGGGEEAAEAGAVPGAAA